MSLKSLRTTLVTAVAGAVLLAGTGVAVAQPTNTPGAEFASAGFVLGQATDAVGVWDWFTIPAAGSPGTASGINITAGLRLGDNGATEAMIGVKMRVNKDGVATINGSYRLDGQQDSFDGVTTVAFQSGWFVKMLMGYNANTGKLSFAWQRRLPSGQDTNLAVVQKTVQASTFAGPHYPLYQVERYIPSPSGGNFLRLTNFGTLTRQSYFINPQGISRVSSGGAASTFNMTNSGFPDGKVLAAFRANSLQPTSNPTWVWKAAS